MKSTLLFIVFSVFLCNLSLAQEYRFNEYTIEDGIPQNFIYSINQDARGYLWIGTGEGLCKFDGRNFVSFSSLDGLAEDVITCSFESTEGTVWFGHNEGGITKFKNGSFTTLNSTENEVTGKINGFTKAGDDVFFVSQNQGLFQISNDSITKIGSFGKDNFFCVQSFDSNNILIGTDEGTIHIQKNGANWVSMATNQENSWVSAMTKSNEPGVILIGFKEGRLLKSRVHENKIQFSTWNSETDISEYEIQNIMQDKDDNIWMGTFGQGLIKLEVDTSSAGEFDITSYNENTGLASNFVQSAFQDREGNIWVGTFGQGLYRLIDDFFTFYSHDESSGYGNSVHSIWDQNDVKWYGVENGLIRISPEEEVQWQFFNHTNGFVTDKITSLYERDSVLWIGTENKGFYKHELGKKSFTKINNSFGSLANHVNQITVDESSVWVATEGGLVVYNIKNKTTNLFDTQIGLAHNSIKSVYKGRDGKIWMGTKSRFLFCLHNSSIEEFEITTRGELEIIDISEDQQGNIWLATSEFGVYQKIGDKFAHFSIEDGLKSNYCYAVDCDTRGNVWIGHRGALSRVSLENFTVESFDHHSGIDAQINFRATFLDQKGNLWFGTDKGAIKYNPQKDKKVSVPPVINLLNVKIGEEWYNQDQTADLSYDSYRIQFDFIGISFTEPEEVTYKYKLKGHDEIYSNSTKETSITYSKINDGDYTFEVIACNGNGDCSETPATFSFHVGIPFWKAWWFYVLVVGFVALVVYLLIRSRVKRFKATQAYLEEQLAIKTKEVVEKAEKIEEINIDLTASINYAERIQSAILPEIDVLNNHYENSFIFFKPRDVVSGDFYFVREYDDKIVVACCDCTGHGVPGAFMSMIGSTTLRNIYKLMENSGEWKTPEMVLETLDEEIQKILHQQEYDPSDKDDFLKSRDGMDLTLAEINTKTNEVLLCSAKRHSFIAQNGEIEILSGDKRAIGGGEVLQRPFTLKRIQMQEGDALFMFSDGYPDQFGGPDGRKLKLSGARKIIEGLSEVDKSQYSERVKSNFELWQAEYEQIDDVLFMGILF